MALSNDLMSQFAKITRDDDKKQKETTVYGTIVDQEGTRYVRLDGSDLLTPISSTADAKNGERVTVMIKNHSAIVNGNLSSPSARTGDVEDISDQISDFEIVIANKVDTIELDAERARIDELEAKNVTISGKLDANEAEIEDLKAHNVTVDGKLEAADAEIENLKTKKLDVDIADIKYAAIDDLEAVHADIYDLEADYGQFKNLTTDKFTAVEADIKDLDAQKLSAQEADIKYANIDFANIGKAAIENFFAKSGMIGDLVVGDGTITGTLVGVTIKGDLIEGGTVVADKLVIKGTDGLYYKLNTNGETVGSEQTEYNSLNGSVITAKSITAEKISVHDLVAFGATIGGYHITENSLYSGVKSSADNTTRGVFLGDDGQFAVGDSNNFLKFFKDTDGSYKLVISASSIVLGASGEDIETVVGDAVKEIKEEFYLSTSPTSLSGGVWLETQPIWESGKYIWRRTIVFYGDGSMEYTPSEDGVCITGNTGEHGEDSVLLQILSSNGNMFKNSTLATTLTVTIIVAGEMICSSREMHEYFGKNASIAWEQKRFGEQEFSAIDPEDNRLSDEGFILTLTADDVYTQTVFNCKLNY